MKIYVAARIFEIEKVRYIYRLLEKSGHQIAADWTYHKNIKPYDKHPKFAKDYAEEDMDGVKNCDIFILLTSEETGSGNAGELGAAILSFLLRGKPKIYVVGSHMGKNFFYFHPTVN